MGDMAERDQARKAISHALQRIHSNGIVGYQMGLGTETFALLTEALATLTGKPVREVREHFAPEKPLRIDENDGERLEFLQRRLMEMPGSYTDLLGFPRRWTELREAIDDARATE